MTEVVTTLAEAAAQGHTAADALAELPYFRLAWTEAIDAPYVDLVDEVDTAIAAVSELTASVSAARACVRAAELAVHDEPVERPLVVARLGGLERVVHALVQPVAHVVRQPMAAQAFDDRRELYGRHALEFGW